MAWSYVDGANSNSWTPSGASLSRYVKARLYYQITETETTYKVDVYGAGSVYNDNINETIYGTLSKDDVSVVTGSKSYSYSSSGTNHTNVFYNLCKTASSPLTYTWTKSKTSAPTYKIRMNIYRNGYSSSIYSNAIKTFTVPKLKEYTITLNYNNGSSSSTSTHTDFYGETYELPSVSRTGYTFLGWSTSSTATSASYSSGANYTITANVTLYAVWKINTYKVTFDAQGGSSVSSKTYDYNTAYGTLPTTTKTGYTFKGWYTSTTGGTKIASTDKVTSARTVYAQWTPISYSITYTLNGGTNNSNNPSSYTIETATITLQTPQKNGYTFTGWTGSNGSTKQTEVHIATGSTGNKSYTANWTPTTYSITYTLGSGGSASNPSTYTIETATISLNQPTRTGYTFTGWTVNTSPTSWGSGSVHDGSTTFKIGKGTYGNIKITAKWTAISYSISYTLNGGTNNSNNPSSYTVASAAITLRDPTRTGYNFVKWTDNKGNTITTINQGSTGNKTCVAHWTPITCNVTLNANGGSASTPSEVTATYDAAMPTITKVSTRTGYTLQGYYDTNANSGGTQYYTVSGTSGASARNWNKTSDTTLYARWKANSYKVTFNSNITGGTVSPTSINVTYDSTYGTLPTPVKSNHTFGGWYTATSGGTKKTASTQVTITQAETLYAHWTGNKINPKFVDGYPRVQRCDESGNYDAENKYCSVTIKAKKGYKYSNTDDTIPSSTTTITVNYKLTSAASYTTTGWLKKVAPSAATAGRSPQITENTETTYVIVNNNSQPIEFDIQKTHNIQLILNDTTNSTTTTSISLLTAAIFPLDFNANGTAAGFFRVAPDTDSGLVVGHNLAVDRYLTVGQSARTEAPTGAIKVHDIRSIEIPPGMFNYGANFFFSNNTMPTTSYWSGIHINGWTDAYNGWELVGSSNSSDQRTTPLYVRVGNTTSGWGSWRKIYDSSNPPAITDTTGTLSIAKGGTGQTTAKAAANGLISGLANATANVQDATLLITSDVASDTNVYYKRPATTMWNYIQGKTDAAYLKLSGGTITGATTMNSTLQIKNILTLYREGTTDADSPAGIKFSVKDTTNNQSYSSAFLYAYQDHAASTAGCNIVLKPGGSLFIGSGESPSGHYAEKSKPFTAEHTFITSDQNVYIQAKGATVAERLGFYVTTAHNVLPCLADVATNNVGSIGSSSYKWKTMYATTFYGSLSGTASTATTVSYTTTAPTAANSSGLKFAVLSSSPATKYSGWVYLIKE